MLSLGTLSNLIQEIMEEGVSVPGDIPRKRCPEHPMIVPIWPPAQADGRGVDSLDEATVSWA